MNTLFKAVTPDEQLQFDEEIRKHTEQYHPFQLKINPFPLGGNYPDAYLSYTFLSPERRSRIQDFLMSTFVREEFNGLLVKGEYGSGKSHILHYIREQILSSSFFGNKALCFLIQNPSVAPEDILLSMLREVKLGVIQDLIFSSVAAALKEKYNDAEEFISNFAISNPQKKLIEVQGDLQWFEDLYGLSYREFLKRLTDHNVELNKTAFRDFATEALQNHLNIERSLIDDFVKLITTDGTNNTQSWEVFLSSRLMSNKKGSLGIEYYLQAFLELFKSKGVRHIYLLVDEFEDLRTQRLTNKATVEYLAKLRKMIQHNYKMFSLVLACTRDAWNDLLTLYPAIEDRFPLLIDLVLDKIDLKNVISSYLQRARLEGQSPQSEYAPFTEEAVELIIEKRAFVLRHILTEMRALLDIAANKAQKLPIDEKFVLDNISFNS
jgi:hypothetical protein